MCQLYGEKIPCTTVYRIIRYGTVINTVRQSAESAQCTVQYSTVQYTVQLLLLSCIAAQCTHRRNCDYDYKTFDGSVDSPSSLRYTLEHRVSLTLVRKAARCCFRYASGYKEGMTGPLLDYAVKQYKGHRAIPANSYAIIKESFEKDKK